LILDKRSEARRLQSRSRVAGESLTEYVTHRGVRDNGVSGVRREGGLQVPGGRLVRGVGNRERHRGQELNATLNFAAPDRGGEAHPDAAGGAEWAAAAQRRIHSEGAVGVESPTEKRLGRLGIHYRRHHQLAGAVI